MNHVNYFVICDCLMTAAFQMMQEIPTCLQLLVYYHLPPNKPLTMGLDLRIFDSYDKVHIIYG